MTTGVVEVSNVALFCTISVYKDTCETAVSTLESRLTLKVGRMGMVLWLGLAAFRMIGTYGSTAYHFGQPCSLVISALER
jgi:hypothetical protein